MHHVLPLMNLLTAALILYGMHHGGPTWLFGIAVMNLCIVPLYYLDGFK